MQPNYQPYQQNQQAPIMAIWYRYKAQIVLFVIIMFIGWLAYYIATHSYITINLSGGKAGDKDIVLLDQDSNTSISITTSENLVKRLVRKSNYEVYVTSSSGSSWLQTATQGFMRNKEVSAILQAERNRTFIADNPGGCMNYDQQLISYTCGSETSTVAVHNQSKDANNPPIASFGLQDTEGIIKGVVNTPSGVIALIKQESEDEELPGFFYSFLSLASGSFTPSSQKYIGGELQSDQEYSIKSYKEGVLLYNNTYTDILYYPSVNSAAQRFRAPEVEEDLRIVNLDTTTSSLVVQYSNNISDDTSASETSPGTRTAIAVNVGTPETKTFYFDQNWNSASICGSTKLCTTTSVGEKQQMFVYDISGKEPVRDFFVNNVSQIIGVGNTTLAITNKGILRIDPTKRTGSIDYSFREYGFCGTGATRVVNQYIVCVTAKDGNHVLLIDTSLTDSNQIDKKVEELRKNTNIDTIIVDRQRIFIVPNYGEPEYSEEEDGFINDPGKVTSANNSINATVTKLQLSQLGFEIVNVSGN